MPAFRMFLLAAAGTLLALFAAPLASSPAPAGASTITSPPTVAPTNWTNANAAAGSGSNQLNDVSCTTSTFCVAVGTENLPGGGTLIEQWNGTTWTVVPSVNAPATTGDTLTSVSCVGTTFCLAVGGSTTGPAVAETWNGTAWSFVSAAAPTGSTLTNLSSVSCVSATTCEVLGTATVAGTNSIFGNQWNGTTLAATTAATPPVTSGTPLPSATGMDCVTASWCIAVGNGDTTPSAPGSSFSELWSGTAWVLLTTPQPTIGLGSLLSSVSCAGVSFCQAVGQVNLTGPLSQNLIESWNGTQWTITATVPDTSATSNNTLTGVDCFSATTCSAVGSAAATSGPSPASLALTWNGTAWSIVPNTPNQGSVSTSLGAVTCLTDWSCVAVGNDGTAGPATSAFAMAAPIARTGYRFVASDGGVFSYGSGAPFLGSMGGTPLNKPVVGMAVMPGGDGYYLVASDGGIFSFGSAQFYGSTGSMQLNAPIVGMAVTPDGAGYWLVASDGGIFSYGDAQFYGSTGSLKLNKPIVGMAATPDGKGYYLVASDGGIFNYGDATFQGSAGSLTLNQPVVGMAAPLSGGYYLVASDGGIFTYPTTNGPPFYGSTGSIKLNKPIVGMTAVANGYYLSGSDGGVFTYPTTNGPTFYGSTGSIVLNKPIVGIAG
jgi:hypothetical protein